MITYYKHIAACVATVAAILAVATHPSVASTATSWFVLVGGYGLLALWAAIVLWRQGTLGALIRPRSGDLTLGIVAGLVLSGTAFFALRLIAPDTSPRSAWLFALYAQFGDVQGDVLRLAGLLFVVACEELVWRGLLLASCVEAWGSRRGLPIAVVSYAIGHLPSLFTLQVAPLGLNPLLVVGALGCGLVWSVMVLLTGRVAPALVCHAVLSYFVSAPAPSWLW